MGEEAVFDARAFVVPPFEVCNYFIWRQRDWERNSLNMVARANFSQNAINGLNQKQIQDKLWSEKEINWNNYQTYLRRGSCIIKDENGKWCVDENIPQFVKDRNYVNQFIPELTSWFRQKSDET